MEAALDGADAEVEEFGDVVVGVIVHVEECDDGALFVCEAADGVEDGLAEFGVFDRVGGSRVSVGELAAMEGDGVKSGSTREAVAVLEDDSLEPSGEGAGLAERGEPGVGLDEGFLGGVLGEVEVTEDGEGVSDGHALEAEDEALEGGDIASGG